ncbi:hypothetical protein OY671_008811 [Metschnikowia pulcherrima]|nr:hypothetical protein OY671_008811 [Metschnikowia pulcherrima]
MTARARDPLMEMGFNDIRPPGDSCLVESGGHGERSRPLGWPESCARPVAAPDSRKAGKQALPGSTTSQGGASFHGLAARLSTGGENVETPVNPTRSTNGKAEGGTLPAKQTPPSPPVEPS